MSNALSGEAQTALPMSAAEKTAAVILGALITGIGWKIRGACGWGSLWGLLCVGFFYGMYIIVLSGGAKRLTAALLGFTGFSFMFTAPAWGTINTQILGILPGADVTDTSVLIINPASGAFLMLAMGFGMATLFAMFVGLSFSGKSYKLWNFFVILALFFIIDYFSRAFVSPYILRLVQPQAEKLFEYGLSQVGYNMSAHKALLTNMFDWTWAKEIVGGRNYFASIKSISAAICSVCLALVLRFALKDKTAARIMTFICTIFAFSILAADLFLYISDGGYQKLNLDSVPRILAEGWSLWEYFTGFIAGGIMTTYILRLIKKHRYNIDNTCLLENPQKFGRLERPVTFIFTILLCIGISAARAVISRLTDTTGIDFLQEVAFTFALAIVPCLIIAAILGFKLEKVGVYKFCLTSLPCVLSLHMIIFFFIGDSSCTEWRHFSVSVIPLLMLISWIVFLSIYFVLFRKEFRKNCS